jgi:(1->4)-alpha-D-glucan 1-alpha-D-glucosylmutase
VAPRRFPRSTYRVQLHSCFTFDDAAAIVDYLSRLGVGHVYCSPYLQAEQGSTHGYDVVDHSRLNDDLGGAPAHARFVQALAEHSMGHILDIVPNHMARDGRANRWWWDVLENGPSSRYATYFDIDWEGQDPTSEPTVLVPVLGDHYGRVLEAGELKVVREEGSFLVRYHDQELPISPRSADDVLAPAVRRSGAPELVKLAKAFGRLPAARRTDREAVEERHRRKEVLRERLAHLCEARPGIAKAIDAGIEELNRDHDALDSLLRRQNFRLAFWRTASEELDYRRFFNIEALIGLRTEDDGVFAESHALVLRLVRDGIVDGLRIDHVDGLRDSEGYLHRLRRASGEVYTVVEKILEREEDLPASWPVEGTTGYDFASRVNNLFVDSANEAAMSDCYARFTGETEPYAEIVHAAKHQIMREELAAEIARLTRLLVEVADGHRRQRDHTRRELRDVLREVIAAFAVYRIYVQPDRPVSGADRARVAQAIGTVRHRRPDIDRELLEFIGDLLLLRHPGAAETEFAVRFQQVSAPVMAKGVEDTAFYRYNRLISLNEVGGDPSVFGRPPDDFHAAMARSAERWPHALLTLSTHDTKRSADVRARLNLLSEIPDSWGRAAERWAQHNQRWKTGGWPDANTEYLLYQTLVGAWPLGNGGAGRAGAFMEKAAKEAKVHTNWIDPAPAYDQALASFLAAVLADGEFVVQLEAFLAEHRLVELGRVSSLAQTTLLLTAPGIPDIYQGTEIWDLSLVDPDNRRPVDYELRRRLLDDLSAGPDEIPDPEGEASKLWLISRLLNDRKERPAAYRSRRYEVLSVEGSKAQHAVAFSRGDLAVVVPRLVAGLAGDWSDTIVTLPPGEWTDVLTRSIHAGGPVKAAELLGRFPVAVLAPHSA